MNTCLYYSVSRAIVANCFIHQTDAFVSPLIASDSETKDAKLICAASLCYVFAFLAIQTWTEEAFIHIVVQQTRLLVNIVVKCLL